MLFDFRFYFRYSGEVKWVFFTYLKIFKFETDSWVGFCSPSKLSWTYIFAQNAFFPFPRGNRLLKVIKQMYFGVVLGTSEFFEYVLPLLPNILYSMWICSILSIVNPPYDMLILLICLYVFILGLQCKSIWTL